MVCLDATNYCSVLDAVYYDNNIVGPIPYNPAPKISAFLKRDVNKGFAEITGMNRVCTVYMDQRSMSIS